MSREQQYKLETDMIDVHDIFAKIYILRAQTANIGIKEALEKQGIGIIKELNEKYKCRIKKLDKKIINVQNEKFQVWYAAQIKTAIPYLEKMEEAAKAVDEGKEFLARLQAITSIPIIEGTVAGIEEILIQAVPIKKKKK